MKSEKEIIEAISSSFTIAETLRKLGLAPAGGNYTTIRNIVKRLNVDISHWLGQGHMKGKTRTTTQKYRLNDALVQNSPVVNTRHLKERLIDEGVLKNECAICGLFCWRGKPLVLQIDHINGIHSDNRIENIRLLCPNCHSQTDTFTGKNKGSSGRIRTDT